MSLPILPDVAGQAIGGQLGLSGGGNIEELGIIGVSSAGPAGVQTIDPSMLPGLLSLYGTGPLARAIKDAFQGGAQILKTLRCTTSQVGAVDTPNTGGKAGTGTIGFTGNPLDEYQLVVRITAAGALGTARFRWSSDMGHTWSDELVTAATVLMSPTGVTVTFTNAGSSVDGSFLVDDVVRVRTIGPSPTANEVGTAIDTFRAQAWSQNGQGPHIILIAGPTGDTVWAGAATKVSVFHGSGRYVAFIAETRPPTDAETAAAWVAAMVAAKTTVADFVGVSAGRLEMVDQDGLRRETGVAALYSGRLMAIPAQQNPARVKADRAYVGPIPGARALRPALYGIGTPDPIPSMTDSQIKTLSDAGFITCRSFFGKAGVYFTDGRMTSAPSSDFGEIDRVRPALKALHAARLACLEELFGDGSQAGLRQIEAVAQDAINQLIARGEIPETEVEVPLNQDIGATGFVAVNVRHRFTPKAKWILISAQWKRGVPTSFAQ